MLAVFRYSERSSDSEIVVTMHVRHGVGMGSVYVPWTVQEVMQEMGLGVVTDEPMRLHFALAHALIVAGQMNMGVRITGDRSAWPDAWGELPLTH